jgi:integrase
MENGVDQKLLAQMIQACAEETYRKVLGTEAEMRAWVLQRDGGWAVRWHESGRQRQRACGKGREGRALAEKLRRQIDAEITLKQRPLTSSLPWPMFVAEYTEKVVALLKPKTQISIRASLAAFERLVRPADVCAITARDVDTFTAKRQREESTRGGQLSPASVNTDLRNLRTALKRAHRWGYLKDCPDVKLLHEPVALPRPVVPEDFDRLYAACAEMSRPEWWRAFIVAAYMTGWRRGELLGLKREDLDLDQGVAIVRAETSKSKRDELIPLHDVVIEHLRKLAGFTPCVLHFPHNIRTLTQQWYKLQRRAGIRERYKLHDLRRSFCSFVVADLPQVVQQRMARHKSFETTRRHYINPTREMAGAVAQMRVPGSVAG